MVPSRGINHVLVTPVYRDSERLESFGGSLAKALTCTSIQILWVIADDGSGPEEISQLKRLVDRWKRHFPDIALMPHSQHQGKGGAVRTAWDRYPEARWLSFCDSDGSFRPADILNLLREAEHAAPVSAVLGSRRLAESKQVRFSLRRKLAHNVFATLTRLFLPLSVGDPQCGAKVIPGEAYRRIRPTLQENGFIFDCELLLALRATGIPIREAPLAWTEKKGSRVSLLRDGILMLSGLLRLKRLTRSQLVSGPV